MDKDDITMDDPAMAASVLLAGSLHCQVGWSAAAHSHPYPELLLVEAGRMEVEVGDARHRVEAGAMLAYPPGVIHRECNAGRAALDLVWIIGGLVPDLPPGPINDRRGRLRLLVRWLLEDQAGGTAAIAAWRAAIVGEMGALAAVRPPGLADAARERMRAGLALRQGLDVLARAAGLGVRQFQRRYRAETGRSPAGDLRRLRCEAAAELLLTSGWGLRRIAETVGFCDQYHCSRAIRRHFGVPPGEMRRTRRVHSPA